MIKGKKQRFTECLSHSFSIVNVADNCVSQSNLLVLAVTNCKV